MNANSKSISLIACFVICFAGLKAQSLQEVETSEAQISSLIEKIQNLDVHCEVPCGIYGDSLRVSLLKEHSKTVEKAMKQIEELSKADKINYNQIVRWVNNKEKHAEEIQEIVSQYFLHQRIKLINKKLPFDKVTLVKEKYQNQLGSLHEILVYAMKCKQSTDLGNIQKLNSSISDFESYYFHGHKH